MHILNPRYALAVLALSLLPANLASAEQIYIRNRPFQGAVTRAEGERWLELKSLAEAFRLNVIESPQGGIFLASGKSDAPPEVAAGRCQIGTETMELRLVDGLPHVGLQAFAQAVGAKVIINKELKTVDVSVAGAIQPDASPAPSPGASKKEAAPPKGNVVRIQGKIVLAGCNQVGLFRNDNSGTPYKLGSVDRQGNYAIDIDLDKDLILVDGAKVTDMRFFRQGAFDEAHGRCHFIFREGSKVKFQVYEGPIYEIKNKVLEYTEQN